MQRKELQELITRLLNDGYESDVYREYIAACHRKSFSQENYQDMLAITQALLKKPDLSNKALVWDLYLAAREGIKPCDPSHIFYITIGMLHQSRYAFNLRGLYILEAVNCEVDYDQAYDLFWQAKELGSHSALSNLGLIYRFGLGRERDDTQARYFFELAAEQQHPVAFYQLAFFAREGLAGFKQDHDQMFAFLKKAVALGSQDAVDAIYKLTMQMYLIDDASGEHTEKAISLLTIAAEQDHAGALTQLGYIYYTQKKYSTAMTLNERAAQFNEPTALNNLGNMYLNGEGTERNATRALQYFKRAFKAGKVDSSAIIAESYLQPEFGPNPAKAIKYFKKGIRNNVIYCLTKLASYYYDGSMGIAQNTGKAVKLWLKGSKVDNLTCLYNLAYTRLKRLTTAITEEKAWLWLNKAIALKWPMACFFRAELYRDANQPALAAKFFRIGFNNCGRNHNYDNFWRPFSAALSGTPLARYHWYMTNAGERLPPNVRNLYDRYPCAIIQAILTDDIINEKTKLKYLRKLPGNFLQQIKSLSMSHPSRISLESMTQYCQHRLIAAYYEHKIKSTRFLVKLNKLSTLVGDARLSAYLTMSILFDAILKDWIDELEIPRALARIYQCHKTIIRSDQQHAEQNILNDYAHQSYLSLDAYLAIFIEHMLLIEAYVQILCHEIAKISDSFSQKQMFALRNASGLLMLTDDVIKPDQPYVHQEHISKFIDNIKAIHTPTLWLTLKEKRNVSQQLRLSQALQFFHAGKEMQMRAHSDATFGLATFKL